MAVPEVFVISLQGCEERRAPLLNALTSLGFKARIILGVDGRQGLDRGYEKYLDRDQLVCRAKRQVTDGEIACALSHQAAYRMILQSECETAVVLEDDASLTDNFGNAISMLGEIDFDMVLFDYEFCKTDWKPRYRAASGIRGYRVRNSPDRNTGYALTKSAARYLHENSLPLRYLADWPVDISRLNTFAITPRAVERLGTSRGSLLEADRKKSQQKAKWGNPSPPLDDTAFGARLSRFFSRPLV